MKKRSTLLILVLLLGTQLFAQKKLSLEECVAMAQQNNIQVRQMQNSLEVSEANYQQSKYDFLPSLNANLSYSQNWGTTFDFNVFRPVTQSTGSSNLSISSSLTLFNGLRKVFTLRQRESDVNAARHGIDRMKNDIQTNVALFFFQVVYGTENLRIVDSRLTVLERQLEKTSKQFEAGIITRDALMSLESQLASERLNKINAENQLLKDKLSLMQLLEMDVEQGIDPVVPDLSTVQLDLELPPLESVYEYALNNMPQIKEQQARITSSNYGLRAARALYLPTVTLSGGLYSSYSSNGVLDPGTFQTVETPYLEQVDQNFRQGVTIGLNVPLFNQLQTRTSVQVNQLNLRSSQLELNNQRNTLRKNIQQAWLDVKTAQVKYDAVQEQLKAVNEAFTYAEKKFGAGLIDFYSYIETLNNKTQAEIEVINSKYDYLFKKGVLDVYQGKPLKF